MPDSIEVSVRAKDAERNDVLKNRGERTDAAPTDSRAVRRRRDYHVLFDGDPDELCLTGENVDAVLWLLLGLEPDSDVSVLSVLLLFVIRVAMLCVFAVVFVCSPSPSLESSEESPVNGLDRIWLALCAIHWEYGCD